MRRKIVAKLNQKNWKNRKATFATWFDNLSLLCSGFLRGKIAKAKKRKIKNKICWFYYVGGTFIDELCECYVPRRASFFLNFTTTHDLHPKYIKFILRTYLSKPIAFCMNEILCCQLFSVARLDSLSLLN